VPGAFTFRSHCVRGTLVVGVALALAAPAWAHPSFDEMERYTDGIVAAHPEDPVSYLDLAQTRRLAGNWDGALLALEHAAAHGAKPIEVSTLRGAIYFDAGWANMALFEADRALAIEPAQPQVQILRAKACMALGRPADAARAMRVAIDGMKNPTPDHVLALRDAALAAGDRAGAIAALDLGLTRVGLVPSLALPALDLELELGRNEDALRRIDVLLATNPKNEAWLARRGDVLDRLGRREEARLARADALAAIQSRPDGRRGERSASLERELRAALVSNNDAPPEPGKRTR
jgi:tetratricopeptide (TPR) repeat protein